MALDDTQLPPQATGATLPGQAADAADIAPAPSAEDALLAANFGTRGASSYRAIRDAGRRAPGLANLAGADAAPATAAPPTPSAAAPGGDTLGSSISNLLGATLGGIATGDPAYGAKLAAARGQATARAQQLAQQQAITDAKFIADLKDKPINMRAAMVQAYAAKQGRNVSPAEALYVADVSPEVIEHTIERAKSGDVAALQQLSALTGGDPVKLVDAQNEMRKSSAAADKMVADATKAQAEAPTAGADAALKAANQIRMLQKPPSPQDIAVLDAAGLEAIQVPVPGAPDGVMWTTRKKATATPGADVGPGAVSPDALRGAKAKEAADTALAKEQATTTAATRTMKEQAPKVRELANEVEADLAKIQAGPGASRLQDFLAGKVGAPNENFIHYRDNALLLGSLLMRMHVGAKGGEYMGKKFDDMIGANKQSPENMRSTLNVIRRYADIVDTTKEGSDVALPSAAPGRISAKAFLGQ